MDYSVIIKDMIDSFNNGHPMTACDASKKYDCSVSSIRKYIARLKNSDSVNDISLYNEYCAVSSFNKSRGVVLGGKNGKRGSKYSLDVISDLCDYIIETDSTLREVEKETRIPKSTLSDNFKRLNNPKLQDVYDAHRRNSVNDYENDVENGSNFDSVGSELSNYGVRIRK